MLREASIKQKLEAIILLTASAVLLLSLLLFIAVELHGARDVTVNRMQSLATVLGANSSATIVFRDSDTAGEILSTLASQPEVLWASIVLPDERHFAEYRSARHAGVVPVWQEPAAMGLLGRWVQVEEPIAIDGQRIGRLRIIADMSHAYSVLKQQALMGLGVFVLSMLIAMLLSSRLQRLISVPLQRLLETIEAVAVRKDFSLRAERLSNDELGNLVDGFNVMLDRIQVYDRELLSYHQELEQKVRERTHDLELARERAEAASRAKSDFLAAMSHEIRTPMNGVVGFTSLLQQTELDDQQLLYLQNISSSTDGLLNVIDDILDFSKMESGMLNLEPTDFDLISLLDSVQALFAPKAQEKGILLDVKQAPGLQSALHGDPLRLRQVLLNLLGNAIKFTDEGVVSVRVESALQPDKRIALQINVSDTGIGISPEQQALLFQPFQQCDGSITRRYGGTGLGLVITQRLVRMMGGEMTFSSVQGQGSTFSAVVYLEPSANEPARESESITVADSHSAPLPAVPPGPSLPSGLKVLVVDDNPLNLTVATTLLGNQGVEVVAVEGAEEALVQAASQSFSLVLMDLEMPAKSGIEAAQELRRLPQWGAVPIIALTAHAFPEKRREVLDAGMNDLLTKPYKPEQLFAMIAQWCGGEAQPETTTSERVQMVTEPLIYDHQATLTVVGGDEATARMLLEKFIELLPESGEAIRAAHKSGDYSGLYDVVHKLAGSTSIVGAVAIHAEAMHLQNLLKNKPLPVASIDEGVATLLDEITCFQRQPPI